MGLRIFSEGDLDKGIQYGKEPDFVHQMSPTVVSIVVDSPPPLGMSRTGAGVIVSDDGLVLTVASLLLIDFFKGISTLALRIKEDDGHITTYEAEPLYYEKTHPLALLKIKNLNGHHFHYAQPSILPLEIGYGTYFLDPPPIMGYYQSFVSCSLENYSALNKPLPTIPLFGDDPVPFIVTRPFGWGDESFGGPIFNSRGEVVAILAFSALGYNFSVHLDKIHEILQAAQLNQLVQGHPVGRSFKPNYSVSLPRSRPRGLCLYNDGNLDKGLLHCQVPKFVQQMAPTVVSITNTAAFDNSKTTSTKSGAGVIVSREGLVLTLASLVEFFELGSDIVVQLHDGQNQTIFEAQPFYYEETQPLALLKIKSNSNISAENSTGHHFDFAQPSTLPLEIGYDIYFFSLSPTFRYTQGMVNGQANYSAINKPGDMFPVVGDEPVPFILTVDLGCGAESFGAPIFNCRGEVVAIYAFSDSGWAFGIHLNKVHQALQASSIG